MAIWPEVGEAMVPWALGPLSPELWVHVHQQLSLHESDLNLANLKATVVFFWSLILMIILLHLELSLVVKVLLYSTTFMVNI